MLYLTVLMLLFYGNIILPRFCFFNYIYFFTFFWYICFVLFRAPWKSRQVENALFTFFLNSVGAPFSRRSENMRPPFIGARTAEGRVAWPRKIHKNRSVHGEMYLQNDL